MKHKNKPSKNNKKADGVQENVADGFANFVAKQGYGTENLLTAGTYVFGDLTWNRQKLEAMYRTQWITGVVVDTVAEDMTREGITIKSANDPQEILEMQQSLTQMGIWRSILEAIKWGRLYGGAIATIDIDGQDPSTPLRIETVGKDQFTGLTTYDRWQLQVQNSDVIKKGPDAGLPLFYTVVSDPVLGTVENVTYHHTRVIRLIGIQLPVFQAISNQMWGESVVERMEDRLVSFDTATMGAANLIQKAYYRTAKIKDLREILGAGGKPEENLLKQWAYMRSLQTTEGMTLIDTEDEFETHSYNFSGLSDIILQFGQQISGATGIPLVKIFGQSPAGLNATGESDLRNYYDKIKAVQEWSLKEGLYTILSVLHMSLFGKPVPDGFHFDFVPLWQTTSKEKAEIANSTVNTVSLAYTTGLIGLDTALEELKQSSEITGIFSNITDEQIEEAKIAPPPIPELQLKNTQEESDLKPKKEEVKNPLDIAEDE